MRAGKEPQAAASRHNLVQLVYRAIINEVAEGRLASNTRLIQDELAAAYGVSRQPVQQALLLLSHHGVVLNAPRRGFVVAPLSVERIRHMYQVRSALDALASRLAAEHGRERALKEGPAVIGTGRLAMESGSVVRMIEADVQFHTFVSELSGNPIIVEMMVPQYSNMERVMSEILREDAGMPETIWRQHAGILEAIMAGDAKAAERLGRNHVEDASARIIKRFEARAAEAQATALKRRVTRKH